MSYEFAPSEGLEEPPENNVVMTESEKLNQPVSALSQDDKPLAYGPGGMHEANLDYSEAMAAAPPTISPGIVHRLRDEQPLGCSNSSGERASSYQQINNYRVSRRRDLSCVRRALQDSADARRSGLPAHYQLPDEIREFGRVGLESGESAASAVMTNKFRRRTQRFDSMMCAPSSPQE